MPARRVLVVDDSADQAETLAALLELDGHEVRTATSGAAGIQVALDFRPDVVLLDIGMGRMDGYETARSLRRHAVLDGVVLIAVTGYGQEDDRQRTSEAGFAAHLTKPVDLDALRRLVGRVAG